MGHHLRQRIKRKIVHRLQNVEAIITFAVAFFNSYRLAELLPLLPLLFVLAVLSCFPDWVIEKVDVGSEWALSLLLGGKRAKLRDPSGRPTGKSCLYSIVGALDPNYTLPDPRLLCKPSSEQEKELAFPSPAAAGWGNATFLALCMKLAYEDWQVARDVVNHEWRLTNIITGDTSGVTAAGAGTGVQRAPKSYLTPRFVQGCSFHFMQAAGSESSEELSHIHLDSDAMLIAVEDTARPSTPAAAAEGASGDGVALVLAFRGTEPLELADFQSDFDAVPEAGEWGCLHPGFLLALGLDPNLNPYHQTLTTYTALQKEAPAAAVMAARPATPYEVLRDLIVEYMSVHPTAKLYVTGHSLGGALAVVFMGALMHDSSRKVSDIKARVGALYTFGQPRVGDYEFLCHLQVSLLEPSAKNQPAAKPAAAAAHDHHQGDSSSNGHTAHAIEHATRPGGASKLKGLLGRHQEEATAPPLTSRYIRVINTFDIVPHIPPTLCNLYQHGGDLLYLQMTPGSVKFLTEQPMFFITGIFTSSLVKLHHYGKVMLGYNKAWKGSDNYIRFGMRVAAVMLPFLVAGLNDHMPGDYCQSIINSPPAAWQPFKARKKLSRWANAVMFARMLSVNSSSGGTAHTADAATASGSSTSTQGPASAELQRSVGIRGPVAVSAALQAQLMARNDAAASAGGAAVSRKVAVEDTADVAAAADGKGKAGYSQKFRAVKEKAVTAMRQHTHGN